jgi:hypothetical protein
VCIYSMGHWWFTEHFVLFLHLRWNLSSLAASLWRQRHYKPSKYHTTLIQWQPLTEMSTRNISWG